MAEKKQQQDVAQDTIDIKKIILQFGKNQWDELILKSKIDTLVQENNQLKAKVNVLVQENNQLKSEIGKLKGTNEN